MSFIIIIELGAVKLHLIRIWGERMTKTRNCDKGFTLSEMLIVVAIIGILVAVSVPILAAQKKKSVEAVCMANRRSLLSAVRAEELTNPDETDKEWIAAAAKSCGASSVDGYTISGLCPEGGVYTVTFYVDDSVSIACDKHTDANSTYSSLLGSTVLGKASSVTRDIGNGKTQTLAEYLSTGKHIDSEAPQTAPSSGETESWTHAIYKSMNLRTDQMWMIKASGDGGYILYMTTDGKPTEAGKTVNAKQYTYDKNGNITSENNTIVKTANKNGFNYLILVN